MTCGFGFYEPEEAEDGAEVASRAQITSSGGIFHMLERQESGRSTRHVATGSELIGRRVMIGNQPATVTGYNQFNRPPFVFEHTDGTRVFGWRETFYVLPTRAGVEHALRERLLASNFTGIQHEPLRTQVIDQWVDVLAGTVLSLFDSTTSAEEPTQ